VFALGNRRVCIRKGRVCALEKRVFASETLYTYGEGGRVCVTEGCVCAIEGRVCDNPFKIMRPCLRSTSELETGSVLLIVKKAGFCYRDKRAS